MTRTNLDTGGLWPTYRVERGSREVILFLPGGVTGAWEKNLAAGDAVYDRLIDAAPDLVGVLRRYVCDEQAKVATPKQHLWRAASEALRVAKRALSQVIDTVFVEEEMEE